MVYNIRNGPPAHLSKKEIAEIRAIVLQTILDINAEEKLKHELSAKQKHINNELNPIIQNYS